MVDGRIPIQVVNDALDSGFESEDFDTIGGLVLGQLGRVAEVGDEVRVNGHTLRVDEIDGSRVAQVQGLQPQRPEAVRRRHRRAGREKSRNALKFSGGRAV